MDYSALRDSLTAHPRLNGEGPGTHGYIYWHHLFWEHLVDRTRALAERAGIGT